MNFYASADGGAVEDRVVLRVGVGVAVSMVLHGLLLFAYRQGVALPWTGDADAPREALVVTLRVPPAPKAEPEVKPQPVPMGGPVAQR